MKISLHTKLPDRTGNQGKMFSGGFYTICQHCFSYLCFVVSEFFAKGHPLREYSLRHKKIAPCKLFYKSHYSQEKIIGPDKKHRNVTFSPKYASDLISRSEKSLFPQNIHRIGFLDPRFGRFVVSVNGFNFFQDFEKVGNRKISPREN